MKLKIYSSAGKATQKSVECVDSVFGIEPNEHVVHLAVKAELNNLRQGSVKTKSRAEVRGGGKKPWKQKGRGTARAGSTRSPIWVGGGHTFAISPKTYNMALPKKVRRLARRSVLSDKIKSESIVVVDAFKFDAPRTKDVVNLLDSLKLSDKKVLILTSVFDENLMLGGRNLMNVAIIETASVSAYDLIDNEAILMDKASIGILNEQLAE
ncbi:MAG: 50S ribosomal protein L4 [Candidatus Marinimicrobia bacterium]|nr:50S ribosomal protein L4 [Candidatus Neomarinimicrobiota bacterium]MCF7851505.1 50S ribosomal protein L4 [Candidatus Neomarinimicrobiota bacterium]